MINHAARLTQAIETAIGQSLEWIEIGTQGQPATVRVYPDIHQAAAQPTIDAFDWSAAAQLSWEADQHPERKDLQEAAQAAVQDNNTYLAISSPNNAQVVAQVRRLSQQNNRLIRRLVQLQ